MFRFRRAWLLFPLIVLTLFFAACGWRSYRVWMENEEARHDATVIATCNYVLSTLPQSTLVCVPNGGAFSSPRVAKAILKRHPRTLFVPQGEPFRKGTTFIDIEFAHDEGLYYAGYLVTCAGSEGYTPKLGVAVTRSPWTFWDSSWRVTGVIEQDSDLMKLP